MGGVGGHVVWACSRFLEIGDKIRMGAMLFGLAVDLWVWRQTETGGVMLYGFAVDPWRQQDTGWGHVVWACCRSLGIGDNKIRVGVMLFGLAVDPWRQQDTGGGHVVWACCRSLETRYGWGSCCLGLL